MTRDEARQLLPGPGDIKEVIELAVIGNFTITMAEAEDVLERIIDFVADENAEETEEEIEETKDEDDVEDES